MLSFAALAEESQVEEGGELSIRLVTKGGTSLH